MTKNKDLLLLKTLLLSTSQRNIYKHTTDRSKKGRVVGNWIGMSILYIMLMAYCIATCIGYGEAGIIGSAPVLCALTVSLLAFVFTLLKTNGYLFNFKEYDMLMSLPFEASTVAACKFLYMYVKSLMWYFSISLSMLVVYGIYVRPSVLVYPLWIILTFFLPLIPMVIATFLGFLIAKISAGFRKTNIVQVILSFALVLFFFALRFILEDMFRDGKVEETLEKVADATDNAAGIYLPAKWFANAVVKLKVSDILLLVGVSVLLFAVVFRIVGGSYRKINSALKSHAAAKSYKMTGQKTRSVLNAIAFKEFRRMTGSTIYMTNVGMGEVLATILSLVVAVIGFDKLVGIVTRNAPFEYSLVQPAIPFIIYFCLGMMSTPVCSPSLEGKNYWIVQSLPIEKTTLYKGKMLFNMYLTVPFMILSTLCMCISAKAPVLDTILYLILGFALLSFSTTWGCVCGLKHMRLDWENEVEVIKQGAGTAIYMFPNMFAVMGLAVLVIFLGTKVNSNIITIILILIASLLSALCYLRALSLARKSF